MTNFGKADPAEGSEELIDRELEREPSHSATSVSHPLRDKRLGLGYTLEDLAIATGLTAQEIEEVEQTPGLDGDNARRIASVLGVPLDVDASNK